MPSFIGFDGWDDGLHAVVNERLTGALWFPIIGRKTTDASAGRGDGGAGWIVCARVAALEEYRGQARGASKSRCRLPFRYFRHCRVAAERLTITLLAYPERLGSVSQTAAVLFTEGVTVA
jgi:hypothetical protein